MSLSRNEAYILTIVWNLGYQFSLSHWLMPALGVILGYTGFFLHKTKQNWFIGIRTPWTLSSETVWKKTNRLAGKLFIIYGALFCILPFVSRNFHIGIVGSLIFFLLLIVLYSLVLYQRERR